MKKNKSSFVPADQTLILFGLEEGMSIRTVETAMGQAFPNAHIIPSWNLNGKIHGGGVLYLNFASSEEASLVHEALSREPEKLGFYATSSRKGTSKDHHRQVTSSSPLSSSSSKVSTISTRQDLPSKEKCKYYEEGTCIAGKNCTRNHNHCTYFLSGACTSGDGCLNVHARWFRDSLQKKPYALIEHAKYCAEISEKRINTWNDFDKTDLRGQLGALDLLSRQAIEMRTVFSNLWEKLTLRKNEIVDFEILNRLMRQFEARLPIFSFREKIEAAIRNTPTGVVVILAETGAGKSTQIVQYIADIPEYGTAVLCTQPRPLAADALADRVVKEFSSSSSSSAVDVFSRSSARNLIHAKRHPRITFATDSALLAKCQIDPLLTAFSCVVLDEAHERTLHTDLLLSLLFDIIRKRKDFRIVVTSATIDPSLFMNYFGKESPLLEVPGRTFPVEVFWCPPIQKSRVETVVDTVINIHLNNDIGGGGDILVFVVSFEEILATKALLQKRMKSQFHLLSNLVVMELYGRMNREGQAKVFVRVGSNSRKVILSTNIAETSLTIPGVRFVIDTGMSKESVYDAKRNIGSLVVGPVSQSSALQRAGRAGRTSNGFVYRIYSQETFLKMRTERLPEIQRIHLGSAILNLKNLNVLDIGSFKFVEPPDQNSLECSEISLFYLGALTKRSFGRLTSDGELMAKSLSFLTPSSAKFVILACKAKCILPAAAIAGCLQVGLSSILQFPPVNDAKSREEAIEAHGKFKLNADNCDLFVFLNVLEQFGAVVPSRRRKWLEKHFVSKKAIKTALGGAREILSVLNVDTNLWKAKSFKDEEEYLLQAVCRSIVISSSSQQREHLVRCFCGGYLQSCGFLAGKSEKYPVYQTISSSSFARLHKSTCLASSTKFPECVLFSSLQEVEGVAYMKDVVPIDSKILFAINPIFTSDMQLESLCSSLRMRIQRDCSVAVFSIAPLPTNWSKSVLLERNVRNSLRSALPQNVHFMVDPNGSRVDFYINSGRDKKEFSKKNITDIISSQVEIWKQGKEFEVFEHQIVNGTRLVFGKGGEIEQVLSQNDYISISIRAESSSWELSRDAKQILKGFGKILSMRALSRDVTTVTYENSQTAKNALLGINNNKSNELRLHASPIRLSDSSFQSKDDAFGVRLIWPITPSKCRGSVRFDDPGAALEVSNRKSVRIGGSLVKIRLLRDTEGSMREPVCLVSEIPPQCDSRDLYDAFDGIGGEILDCNVFREPVSSTPSSTSALDADIAIAMLKSMIMTFVKRGDFDCSIFPPDSATKQWHRDNDGDGGENDKNNDDKGWKSCYTKAYVTFSNVQDALDTLHGLDGIEIIDGLKPKSEVKGKIRASMNSTLRWNLPFGSWNVVKGEISNLIEKTRKAKRRNLFEPPPKLILRDGSKYSAGSSTRILDLIYVGEMNEATKSTVREIQSIVGGTKIEGPDPIVFSKAMRAKINEIKNQRSVSIWLDRDREVVKVMGSDVNRNSAVKDLFREAKTLKSEVVEFKYFLSNYAARKKISGNQRTQVLKQITESLGVDAAEIEVFSSVNNDKNGEKGKQNKPKIGLLIHTRIEKIEIVEAKLNQFFESDQKGKKKIEEENEASFGDCPICFCEPDESDRIFLSGCCHVYCLSCLIRQVESNDGGSPIQCLADGCQKNIFVIDLRGFVPADIWNRFLTMRKTRYVEDPASGVVNCPTPDCMQLAVFAGEQNHLVPHMCDACLRSYCLSCNGPIHSETIECQKFAESTRTDESFELFLRENEDGYKPCPVCKTIIEKNGGCQHVECRNCHAHFCWKCLFSAKSGQEVYAHLQNAHTGGIWG